MNFQVICEWNRLKYSLRKYNHFFILPHFTLFSGLCESVIILKKGHIFQYRYDNLHHFCLHFSLIGILSSHLKHFYPVIWKECKCYCLLCQRWDLLKTSCLYMLENGRAFYKWLIPHVQLYIEWLMFNVCISLL